MNQKLTADRAGMIRVFREYFSRAAVAREYGVHPDTIRNIEKGASFGSGTSRRKDRQFSDEQVLEIRRLAAEGHKEQAIKRIMNIPQSRSTVRQVIVGKSYQDVM